MDEPGPSRDWLNPEGARVDPDVARAALVQGGDGGPGVGAGPHEQDPAGAQRRQAVGGQVEADGDDAAAGAGEPRGAGDPAGGGRGVRQGAVELGGQRPSARATVAARRS